MSTKLSLNVMFAYIMLSNPILSFSYVIFFATSGFDRIHSRLLSFIFLPLISLSLSLLSLILSHSSFSLLHPSLHILKVYTRGIAVVDLSKITTAQYRISTWDIGLFLIPTSIANPICQIDGDILSGRSVAFVNQSQSVQSVPAILEAGIS